MIEQWAAERRTAEQVRNPQLLWSAVDPTLPSPLLWCGPLTRRTADQLEEEVRARASAGGQQSLHAGEHEHEIETPQPVLRTAAVCHVPYAPTAQQQQRSSELTSFVPSFLPPLHTQRMR